MVIYNRQYEYHDKIFSFQINYLGEDVCTTQTRRYIYISHCDIVCLMLNESAIAMISIAKIANE